MRFRRAMSWVVVTALLGAPSALSMAETMDGPALYTAHKCNMCHGVPAAGIEAKTKSSKLLGPLLGGPMPDLDFAALAAFLRQQQEKDGEEHKREFKGTDEELTVILDWLAELEPPPTEDESPGAE